MGMNCNTEPRADDEIDTGIKGIMPNSNLNSSKESRKEEEEAESYFGRRSRLEEEEVIEDDETKAKREEFLYYTYSLETTRECRDMFAPLAIPTKEELMEKKQKREREMKNVPFDDSDDELFATGNTINKSLDASAEEDATGGNPEEEMCYEYLMRRRKYPRKKYLKHKKNMKEKLERRLKDGTDYTEIFEEMPKDISLKKLELEKKANDLRKWDVYVGRYGRRHDYYKLDFNRDDIIESRTRARGRKDLGDEGRARSTSSCYREIVSKATKIEQKVELKVTRKGRKRKMNGKVVGEPTLNYSTEIKQEARPKVARKVRKRKMNGKVVPELRSSVSLEERKEEVKERKYWSLARKMEERCEHLEALKHFMNMRIPSTRRQVFRNKSLLREIPGLISLHKDVQATYEAAARSGIPPPNASTLTTLRGIMAESEADLVMKADRILAREYNINKKETCHDIIEKVEQNEAKVKEWEDTERADRKRLEEMGSPIDYTDYKSLLIRACNTARRKAEVAKKREKSPEDEKYLNREDPEAKMLDVAARALLINQKEDEEEEFESTRKSREEEKRGKRDYDDYKYCLEKFRIKYKQEADVEDNIEEEEKSDRKRKRTHRKVDKTEKVEEVVEDIDLPSQAILHYYSSQRQRFREDVRMKDRDLMHKDEEIEYEEVNFTVYKRCMVEKRLRKTRKQRNLIHSIRWRECRYLTDDDKEENKHITNQDHSDYEEDLERLEDIKKANKFIEESYKTDYMKDLPMLSMIHDTGVTKYSAELARKYLKNSENERLASVENIQSMWELSFHEKYAGPDTTYSKYFSHLRELNEGPVMKKKVSYAEFLAHEEKLRQKELAKQRAKLEKKQFLERLKAEDEHRQLLKKTEHLFKYGESVGTFPNLIPDEAYPKPFWTGKLPDIEVFGRGRIPFTEDLKERLQPEQRRFPKVQAILAEGRKRKNPLPPPLPIVAKRHRWDTYRWYL